MAAIIDYKDLEDQVQDIIRLESTVVTTWDRSWTNAGRRELQRQHNFPEMLAYHPSAEADVGGASFQVTSASRRVTGPTRFKEFCAQNDGLYLVEDSSEHTLLPVREYEWLVRRYDLDETGEPEYCQVLLDSDGETTYLDVWPKPDATYALRAHFYQYQAVFASSQDLTGVTDFLIANAAMTLRDAVLREAYIALEMRDMALFAAQANRVRTDDYIRESKGRALPDHLSLVPSLGASKGPVLDEEAGYPWWGKK